MLNLWSFLSGAIFAAGLVISSMIDPNRVIGFLKIFFAWDYSLAFVMGGAVLLNTVTFRFIIKQPKPVCDTDFCLPTNTIVDKKLIIGSIIFGIGWGLGGICPGPGLVNLVTLKPKIFVFVASMIVGMFIFKLYDQSVKK